MMITGTLLLAGLLLQACNSADSGAPPADLENNWTEYIEAGVDNLDSYASESLLNVQITDGAEIVADYDEEVIQMQVVGDLEQVYSMTERDEVITQELFFEDNHFYLNETNGWVKYEDAGPIEYDSWYPHVVEALVSIAHLIEANHTDTQLELTYEGYDYDVWEAFEGVFSLTMSGINEDNIHMTLTTYMDESTYYLERLTLDIRGEQVQDQTVLGSVSIHVDVNYFDHDQVDLSEVKAKITEDVE